MPNLGLPGLGAIQPGECSADGRFVWARAADGTGFWRRRTASDTCTATTAVEAGPTTRDHREGGEYYQSGGGVTVAEVPSFRTLEARLMKQRILEDRDAIARMVALAPTLPQCPAEAVDGDSIQACYARTPIVKFEDVMLPPGTFTYLGVPFHMSELNAQGRFEKNNFVPTPSQRFQMDMAILKRSKYEFRDKDLAFNINTLVEKVPDMRWQVTGFGSNPIEPTEAELLEMGGAQKWVNRGGYWISRAVSSGRVAVTGYGDSSGIGITACGSIACACPTDTAAFDNWRTADYSQWGVQGGLLPADQVVSWWPRCIGMVVTPDGLVTKAADGQASTWNVFIAVADDGTYSMHIVIKPESWTSKMAGFMGEQLMKLGKLFCDTQPAVQEQMSTSMAEKCVDKQQKPCTKGATGCTCTKPPAVQNASVAVFNAWSSHWCGEFAKENTPPQYVEPDPNAPTPMVPELATPSGMKWWHWGLLAAAGVGAGAFFFTRRGA